MNHLILSIGLRGIIKSIFIILRCLKLSEAIHFPILLNSYSTVKLGGGKITLDCEKLNFGMIKIGIDGEAAISDMKTRSSIVTQGNLIFKGKANLGKGTRMIILPKGNFTIGKKFLVTGNSSFRVYRNVIIGDDCLFSWDILIMDYDGHRIYNIESEKINDVKNPIIIGNHVWIGCKSTIWKGAIIPNNSVIGMGAMITKELMEESCIYVNKGQIHKTNIKWER